MSDEKRQQLDSGTKPIENLFLFEALNSLISRNSEHLTSLRPLIDAIFARLLAAAPDRGRVVAALKAAHDALQANGIKDRPSQEKVSNLETTLRGKQHCRRSLTCRPRHRRSAQRVCFSPVSYIFVGAQSGANFALFVFTSGSQSGRSGTQVCSQHFQVNGRGDPASYEFTHQEFGKLETMLRQQQIAVDRLLGYRETDGDQRKPVLHALQQTLFLQCPKRGKTAGRFRCVNRTSNAALVDIRQRQPQDTEDGLPDEAIIKFEPIGRRLGPEEAGIFCATVDLSGCQIVSAGRRETFADLYVSGELALKLFICVEIYDEQS